MVEVKVVDNELSDELKEEVKKLREELAKMKEQMENTEEKEKRSRGIYIDVGNNIREYTEDIMESVAESLHGELEKSIFIGPRGMSIYRGRCLHRREEETEIDFPKVATTMNAMSQEHRLKILKELMSGGKYVNDLQEALSEITASTLSSHLKVLEEAGLVVQEKVRGRYLITMPGRVAYKMAARLTRLLERGKEE